MYFVRYYELKGEMPDLKVGFFPTRAGLFHECENIQFLPYLTSLKFKTSLCKVDNLEYDMSAVR